MTTPNTPIASIARLTGLARRARAYSLPLLAAGALAAGCGTVAANPGGPAQIDSSTSASPSTHAAAGSAPPAAAAKPVPTVSGGPMILVGGAACAGWPAKAPHGTLTDAFTPVAVERCVNAIKQIPGKGEWSTATLERSTDNMAVLTSVLMRPSLRQPAVFCPEFVILPPQLVLFNSAGQELIPRLPVGSCGNVTAQVLSTLSAMTWEPISVRLVSKIDPVTLPGASLGPGSPKMLQTAAPTGVENGTPVH